jgi:hypothetical protein
MPSMRNVAHPLPVRALARACPPWTDLNLRRVLPLRDTLTKGNELASSVPEQVRTSLAGPCCMVYR